MCTKLKLDFDKESSVDSINKPRVTEGPKPQVIYI